jgi:hypothetical protein
MTSEIKYKNAEDTKYQLRVLTELRNAVRSIDSKVEDILDELKGHPLGDNGNGFVPPELYDNDES